MRLEIERLSKTYPNRVRALNNVSLGVGTGSSVSSGRTARASRR
jgi:ABC-type phosphate/phosphonate transport system ATPase subunit